MAQSTTNIWHWREMEGLNTELLNQIWSMTNWPTEQEAKISWGWKSLTLQNFQKKSGSKNKNCWNYIKCNIWWCWRKFHFVLRFLLKSRTVDCRVYLTIGCWFKFNEIKSQFTQLTSVYFTEVDWDGTETVHLPSRERDLWLDQRGQARDRPDWPPNRLHTALSLCLPFLLLNCCKLTENSADISRSRGSDLV